MSSLNNMTRTEGRERAGLVNVASYDVVLDLRPAVTDSTTFRSDSTIMFTCREPGATTYVDLTAERVHEVIVNGRSLDPDEVVSDHRVTLFGLAESNEVRIVADCRFMRTGEGLHRFRDPVDGEVYLYTQFETFDAHRMFACFDQPDLKSTFSLHVDAPAHWTVVSNMPAVTRDTGGARRWVFEPTPRMSTYITAVVAGPYHEVRDEHDGIPLGIYCRASLAQFLDPDELFTVTKQGLDFFHRTFAYRYAWPKYDQCFVPEFNSGAMENAGCVTFLEDYVFRSKVTEASYERRAETVLHEMAHMWFGDLVTMRWWDDLWLNESFATYVSVLAQVEATRYTGGWTTFANTEKTWAYRQDQLPTTHPIAADIVDIDAVKVNFDGITYAKGASVLKQLVHWVGRDAFFTGIRTYFRRHEYGNTRLQDLLDVLEESSGRDLSAWSKSWLETPGVNTLRPRFETSSDGMVTAFTVVQEAPEAHPTLRPHRLAVGFYDLTSEGLLRRSRVELDVTGALTEVPQLVGVRRPDLVLVNDDDLTYAKIRLDEQSLATVRDHIGELRDSLPRALCWAAAWDMTRDAEMATRDYLTLVLAGIGAETDVGVVQSLLRQVRSAIELYAEPGWRPTGLRRLAAAAGEHLHAAVPGSDHQLAWTRAFAASATDDEHVRDLRALLDGTLTVPGLSVDTELRWALLHRLVVVGAAGEADIDAELARDDTAAGRRHALAARAARPTEAAKREAWRLAVDSDELPNAEQSAVIAGFVQGCQRDLLRPFRDSYFAQVGEVWRTRTSEMALNVAVGLYPGILVEPETIEATDEYLRREEPPAALRRVLVEGRDGVTRALRAQAKDAQAGH